MIFKQACFQWCLAFSFFSFFAINLFKSPLKSSRKADERQTTDRRQTDDRQTTDMRQTDNRQAETGEDGGRRRKTNEDGGRRAKMEEDRQR